MYSSFFFFYLSGHPRDLHSFPTRRSSDLVLPVVLDVEDLRLLFECASRHTLSRPLSAQRQRELERGSLVLAALRPDATAVELDELLADRKPEPGPAGAPRDRIVQLLERLEQP